MTSSVSLASPDLVLQGGGRRLPRSRPRPLLYKGLNERLNASTERGTKNSFTGRVSTMRFVEGGAPCASFAYRDTAEMNLARYLEACPSVTQWGRRTHTVMWSAQSGTYETLFPFEVLGAGGVRVVAIVDEDIIMHPLWGMFVLEMRYGRLFHQFRAHFVDGRLIDPESVTLDFFGHQPWSSVLTKETADLLLQHRSTDWPEVTAAIVKVLEDGTWMTVQEIVSCVGLKWTYAQVMQMIWSRRLVREDAEKPLDGNTRVGLVRQRS